MSDCGKSALTFFSSRRVDSPIASWYDGRFHLYARRLHVNREVVMKRRPFSGIIISHLGNINGRQPELENTPEYVHKALKLGWHVCIDVVFRSGGFLLPTDNGMYPCPPAFFSKQRVWSRASDAETMDALCNINAHCFLVSENFMSLTSAQFIWTLPPHDLVSRSIAAYPEIASPDWLDNFEPAGLCSNEPARYI